MKTKPQRNWVTLTRNVSIAYAIVVTGLSYGIATCDRQAGLRMCIEPNEIGDLLAGIFAPLAFIWLAAAVLIQSQELAAQRSALLAQKDELAATREELELQRAVMTEHAAAARQQTAILDDERAGRQRVEADAHYEALRLVIGKAARDLNGSYFSWWTEGRQSVARLSSSRDDLLSALREMATQLLEQPSSRTIELSDRHSFRGAVSGLLKVRALLPQLSAAKATDAEREDIQGLIDVVLRVSSRLDGDVPGRIEQTDE